MKRTLFYLRSAIAALLGAPLVFWVLWLKYLAVMNLMRARDAGALPDFARLSGLPILIIGYALDVLCNLTYLTLILGEWPQEWTVSERVERHCDANSGDEGYRFCLAMRVNLLAPFDSSGKHG